MSGVFRWIFGGNSTPQTQIQPQGIQLQTSQMGVPVPVLFGTNRIPGFMLWYGDFLSTAITQQQGGKGGGGSSQVVGYNYSSAFMEGLCEGTIIDVIRTWSNKEIKIGIEPFTTIEKGTLDQPVWPYLTTNHPTEAFGYSGIAFVASAKYDMGQSPSLPNHNFEVIGLLSAYTPAGNTLAIVGTAPTTPASLAYNMVLNSAGTFLYSAAGYVLSTYRIDPATGNPVKIDTISTPGSELTYDAVMTPDGANLYTPLYGSAKIRHYSINTATGLATFVGDIASPGGFGYLAMHPSGTFLFAAGIQTYSIDPPTGVLTAVGTVVSGGGFRMAVNSAGTFLYAVNGVSPSGSLQTFSINPVSGIPTLVNTAATGANPRNVVISPVGNFLYVTDNDDNKIRTFSVDPSTGIPTLVTTTSTATTGLISLTVDPVLGYLYAGVDSSIKTFNPNPVTGVPIPVGTYSGTAVQPVSIAFNQSGFVYANNTNHIYTASRTITPATGGDANPAEILKQILTNQNIGIMVPPSVLGDWTNFANYCTATGILLSPYFNTQSDAASIMTNILQLANSEVLYSEGLIKIIPRGDTTIGGYTPNNTPVYYLTDDDFLIDGGNEPVECTRHSTADAYNRVQVDYDDRNNDYQTASADAFDQGSIQVNGLRPMPKVSVKGITLVTVAQTVSQLMLQRALYVRNTYVFHLGWKYSLLEPMDIVAITDTDLGLNQYPVKITEIEEDEFGSLQITAEDFPAGIGYSAAYGGGSGGSGGYKPDYGVNSGPALEPIVVTAPLELAGTQTNPEIWMATSGNVGTWGNTWGGCDVYLSTDGITYNYKGTQRTPARMGSILYPGLDGIFGPAVDTVDTLSVEFQSSNASLVSGTRADAEAYRTLCVIDSGTNQELIAYQTATLTGAYIYNLTYLMRRLYGSKPSTPHLAGAKFARLDYQTSAIMKMSIDQSMIGKTVYIKLVSFNIFGNYADNQQLALVTPYSFVIQAPFAPAPAAGVTNRQVVSGLEIFGLGHVSTFTGNDILLSWRASTTSSQTNLGSEPYGAGTGAHDPWFKDYEVRIYSGTTLLRTEHTINTFYTYAYNSNLIDTAGVPARTITAKVFERGNQGQITPIAASLTVDHPAPTPPVSTLAGIASGFNWSVPYPADPTAYSRTKIYASISSGFTPSAANMKYEGASMTGSVLGLTATTTYYVVCEPFDVFGSGGYSSEVAVTTL